MKVSEVWIPAILTIAACGFGFAACGGRPSPARPVDDTGRTSIVIQFDDNTWCELRGPARWKVLDDCTGPPIVEPVPHVQAKADCEGCISNPYYTGSAE